MCRLSPRGAGGSGPVGGRSRASQPLILPHPVSPCPLAPAALYRPFDVGGDVGGPALIDDLASHDVAGIGKTVARGRQCAAHAVRAFADHDFDRLGALAIDDDVDFLAGAREPHLDFLDLHGSPLAGEYYAASRALSIGATMSAGFGAANRSPWQTRQPASARNSRCAWVSTPFATTSKFMPRASAISAFARPARSVSCGTPEISLRSMHTELARRRCSVGSEA